MTEDVKYEGFEVVEPEGFLQPKRYRVSYQCGRCGKSFKRTFKAVPADDPPCPRTECVVAASTAMLALQVQNLTRMLEEQRAPAHIGQNVRVKAIDATADIVMTDNKLTDLRDGIRPGETMAPKLPVPMQKAADNFFSGPKDALGTEKKQTLAQKRMEALGRRAIGGAFRNAAVAPSNVLPLQRPPSVEIVNPGFVRRDNR